MLQLRSKRGVGASNAKRPNLVANMAGSCILNAVCGFVLGSSGNT